MLNIHFLIYFTNISQIKSFVDSINILSKDQKQLKDYFFYPLTWLIGDLTFHILHNKLKNLYKKVSERIFAVT